MSNTLKLWAAAAALITSLVAFPGTANAQMNFTGGLHFSLGLPRGDFQDILDRNAYGIDGQFFYSPRTSPLGIGLELSFMNYGNESRREPFSTTIPDVTVNVDTDNNIIQGFLVLRAGPKDGPIRPYADALLGLNYLFTDTKITDSSDGDEVASSTNSDDAAFAYGFGGGLKVPVYTAPETQNSPFEVMLDAGVRFIKGGEADYLKKGSIRRENGAVEFDTNRSKTDMLKVHIGFMIRFGS